jgi:predicted small secreted protein
MKTVRLLALAALALFALTACNTIAGIGKDVKKAGEVVSDTAEDCKGGCDD